MQRLVMLWLAVVPVATLGMLGGHELAYEVTGTPDNAMHGYLHHVPQVALLLGLLALVGASFVERGTRLALWPFPAVVLVGFVAQEHLERLAHTGSVPLLLDKPFFLVGLAIQALVAVAAWVVARLLVRVVGQSPAHRLSRFPRSPVVRRPHDAPHLVGALVGMLGARSPPFAP